MKSLMVISAIIMFFVVTSEGLADDILKQKGELSKIKSEVDQSKARLDSLETIERELQRRIADQEQKMSSDQKLIGRLSRKLGRLRREKRDADSVLQLRRVLLDRTQRRHLGNIRQFYLSSRTGAPLFYSDPNAELSLQKKISYLRLLVTFDSTTVVQAADFLIKAASELDGLTGQESRVSKIKKDREVSRTLAGVRKRQGETEMDRVRRQTIEEVDRILALEEAAEEMAAIIARLEEKRARARQGGRAGWSSVFGRLKGQLSSPYRGKVMLVYGIHVDKTTKLESFSPGITIKGRPGGKVFSVASGIVVYAGSLRGYGNFVIIQHDDEYYTTYANLATVSVSQDQRVQARVSVGSAGPDGLVKFELRKGRETLDPVTWLSIESL